MTTTARTRNPIRFRGKSFMALVLAPEPPVADWLAELDRLLARSPAFFAGRAVVLDVSALKPKPDLPGLAAALQSRGIRILGVEGADAAALAAGLPPPVTGSRPAADVAVQDNAPPSPPPKAVESLLLESPVRSGQSILFPEGDVTVVGSVASGAEIVAGGSIHVYGALRGRAIAGSAGNARARIYCAKLEAELLAIDGYYKTAEDMDQRFRGRSAQVWLKGDALLMAALG